MFFPNPGGIVPFQGIPGRAFQTKAGGAVFVSPPFYGTNIIRGITRDANGNSLPRCVVKLFATASDVLQAQTISDENGNYNFFLGPISASFYVVAYKVGSPDVAGTTVNTLKSYGGGGGDPIASGFAISNVQAWIEAHTFSAGPLNQSFVSVPTAGNLLVVCGEVASEIHTLSISDNMTDGGSWNTATNNVGANTNTNLYVFYKVVGASANTNKQVTLTASGGSSVLQNMMAEYTAAGGTFSLDGTSGATAASGNPDPGAITTTAKGLVIGYTAAANAPSAGTGFTREKTGNANANEAVEDQFTTAAGSYDANWTATSGGWNAVSAGFKSI